ncbi:GNAT family N-acetyltransferase [[Clostridium] fimetarium]|uniref:Acetyltransferase (GNAT) domain-containing protein n=1 Tax=[Clostridium] fimetarium TaxID=99656 RepID=A0A1I0N605_9FIRM|nr:GNAT family N-acetyltransferase [[Clostridium] fimetarium]SEV96516.1 Acetyltransferase (GNAT) domain-containing protein [[Clostridium] fimetarium]
MIVFKENKLDVDTYLYLRQQVNWKALTYNQANRAIKNSMYIITVYEADKPIAMGRIVGDGSVVSYIQDLIVIPSAQGEKIGSKLLEKLIKYVESITEEGTEMMLCLMCAKGRENFYKHHNFIERPTNNLGPGMIQYVRP